MKKATLLVLFCLFTNCTKDTYEAFAPTDYDYYYLTEEATITASQIGNGTGKLDPKGIVIANDKLYVCNKDVLEIFNAKTLAHIKTISSYTKGTTTIPFVGLTSVCIDNGRIYVGSLQSQVFVLDEITNLGINTIGNGEWWQSFVSVFGMVVKDGLLFVKDKERIIKVFETSQITETSNWKLQPIAKLYTLSGWEELYSMDIISGNLIVAGQEARSFLYYNIADIRANAANSLVSPIKPTTTKVYENNLPFAIIFTADWAVTSEMIDRTNHLRLYPKKQFLDMTLTPTINTKNVMGKTPFESIVSIAQMDNRLFLSDEKGQKIRIIKIIKIKVSEQK